MPRGELKSQLKTLQYQREVGRQKASGEISTDYNPNGNYVMRKKNADGTPYGPVIHRFNATSDSAATEQAKEWIASRGINKSEAHLAHIDNVPAAILATTQGSRPAADQGNSTGTNQQWELFNVSTGEVGNTIFNAPTREDATVEARRYFARNGSSGQGWQLRLAQQGQ